MTSISQPIGKARRCLVVLPQCCKHWRNKTVNMLLFSQLPTVDLPPSGGLEKSQEWTGPRERQKIGILAEESQVGGNGRRRNERGLRPEVTRFTATFQLMTDLRWESILNHFSHALCPLQNETCPFKLCPTTMLRITCGERHSNGMVSP